MNNGGTMKKSLFVLIVVASSWVLSSCRSHTTKDPLPMTEDPALQSSMQNLKFQMDQILPFLVSPRAFSAPENQAKISGQIRVLERVSQNVTHSPAMQNQDPTLSFLSRGFHDDIRRARESFEQGKPEYARTTLLSTGAYCIECHTRTSAGPSFHSSEFQQSLTNLRPLDRGEYLLATRQYDAALKEFDAAIKQGTRGGNTVFDLDKATRLSLLASVRFQSDPDKAMQIVDDVLKTETVPFYLKTNARVWKQSLNEWKKEKNVGKRDVLKVSHELIEKGRKRQQAGEERSGDIELMRAQALLHPLLATEKNQKRLGEALYLTGVAYEAVRDLAMWSLHEDYYEVCIRKAPHTEWSSRCYKKLEESVQLGYTGSAGTSVPADVRRKLDDLKALAL